MPKSIMSKFWSIIGSAYSKFNYISSYLTVNSSGIIHIYTSTAYEYQYLD